MHNAQALLFMWNPQKRFLVELEMPVILACFSFLRGHFKKKKAKQFLQLFDLI